jgi:hypothetical protein
MWPVICYGYEKHMFASPGVLLVAEKNLLNGYNEDVDHSVS